MSQGSQLVSSASGILAIRFRNSMNDRLSVNSGHHGISTEGQVEGEVGGKRGGGGSWSGGQRLSLTEGLEGGLAGAEGLFHPS